MAMKLNISYPKHGSQKMVEVEDEKKLRIFTDKRLAEEVPADTLGDDWKGYVFKITGGFDKQGFAMVQGVASNQRVRLMLDGRNGMYSPKRHGCRKRKSVRGCIVGNDLSCLNLVIVKKGPADLPGLTDPGSNKPSMRGPKRASNIRKLWGLTPDDDVRLFVPKRKIPGKNGKKDTVKSPKIQRLVTPVTLRRKRRRLAVKEKRHAANQEAKAKYEQILAQVRKEKRAALLSKKREMASERKSMASIKHTPSGVAAVTTKEGPKEGGKKEPIKPGMGDAKGTGVKDPAKAPDPVKTGAKPPKGPAKDAPKAASKDASKVAATKAPKEAGKETPKDAPKDTKAQGKGAAPKDAGKGEAKDAAKGTKGAKAPAKTQTPKDSPKEATKSQQPAKQTTAPATSQIPAPAPSQTTQQPAAAQTTQQPAATQTTQQPAQQAAPAPAQSGQKDKSQPGKGQGKGQAQGQAQKPKGDQQKKQ